MLIQQMIKRRDSVSMPLKSCRIRDQQFTYMLCCNYAVERMLTSKFMLKNFSRQLNFIPLALLKSKKSILAICFSLVMLECRIELKFGGRKYFWQWYVHQFYWLEAWFQEYFKTIILWCDRTYSRQKICLTKLTLTNW